MVTIGMLLFSGPAMALTMTPDNLAVDFRTSDWAAANGQESLTVSNITVSAGGVGSAAQYRTFLLYQDGVDGLGVQTYNSGGDQKNEPDEVNIGEMLTVTLNEGLYLNGVWISDLYDYEAANYSGENFKADEYGHLVINGDYAVNFGAFDNGQFIGETNGELWVDFGSLMLVDTISFFAGSSFEDADTGVDSRNDYSVIGFSDTPAPVPEPATLFLLGTGIMLGARAFGRRKHASGIA